MRKTFLVIVLLSSLLYANFNKMNGVVTDNQTGLQWQDDYSDENDVIKVASWQEAIDYCEILSLNNHDDWRLPNINELVSLLDNTQYRPALNNIFANYTLRHYWSATYQAPSSSPISAWYIGFDYQGEIGYEYRDSTFNNVRCVRAGW